MPLSAAAVGTWLAAEVIGPHLVEAGVKQMRRQGTKAVAKAIGKETGIRPGAGYRRWYDSDATWTALVHRTNDSYEQLVTSLAAARAKAGIRRRTGNRDEAEALVNATIASFLEHQTAVKAIEIVGHRVEQRIVHLDESVRALADLPTDTADRISRLPPAARAVAEQIDSKDRDLRRVLAALDQDDPAASVDGLASVPPSWVAELSPHATILAAELAQSYESHPGAAGLFQRAADAGLDRAENYARAAIEYTRADRTSEATAALDNARQLGADLPAVRLTVAVLSEDAEQILAAVDPATAIGDVHFCGYYAEALRISSGTDAAIQFLNDAVEAHPGFAGIRYGLAQLLTDRSQDSTSGTRTADRARATELGIEVRDLRRAWKGGGAAAVALLCLVALTEGDLNRVIELGSLPPDGQAWPDEAADSTVRQMVAQAAIGLGDLSRVETILETGSTDEFQHAALRADLLAETSDDKAQIREAYAVAWELVADDLDRAHVWLGCAYAGVTDLPGQAELDARDDELSMTVRAQQLLSADRPAEAAELLNLAPPTERRSVMLDLAYAQMGEIDRCVDVLVDAATRFSNPKHLVRAIERLIDAERYEDAAAKADEFLARVPASVRNGRVLLHRAGIKWATDRQAWGEAADRAQALIDDLGPLPWARWLLVQVLTNSGERDTAYARMTAAPALIPTAEMHAELWISLSSDERNDLALFDEILGLYDQFPTEAVGTIAAMAFFMTPDRPDIAPEVIARYQKLIATYSVDANENPSAPLVRIDMSGSPEDMISALRPFLQPHVDAVDRAADQVRKGAPMGLLSLVAGRSYTSVWTQRGPGCLPIYDQHAATNAQEQQAAAAALGHPVVVDISALAIGTLLPAVWPRLRASFSQLRITTEARLDVTAAVLALRTPSTGTLSWDTAADLPLMSDVVPEQQDRLKHHTDLIDEAAGEATAIDWPELRSLGALDEPPSRVLSWLGTLDLAKTQDLPLWSDDLGLRRLARHEGVRVFGTVDLLQAQAQAGRINEGEVLTSVRLLREEYSVDLPLDEEWIELSAAAAGYHGGPAVWIFTRQSTWTDPELPGALWSKLAERAAAVDAELLPNWVYAGSVGMLQVIVPELAIEVVAELAIRTIARIGLVPAATARCIAAARLAAVEAGFPTPTPTILAALLNRLAESIGTQQAASLLAGLSDELEDADRQDLQSLLLRSTPSTDPPNDA